MNELRSIAGVWRSALGTALVAMLLFPLIWVVMASFSPTADFYDSDPSLLPRHFTFANYAVLGSQLRPLVITIVVALLSALFSLLIGLPAAYGLAAFRWRWASAAMFAVLVTQIVPGVMLATPLFLIFTRAHLLNSIPGLVLADSAAGVPFTVLVLTAFLSGVPSELREASYIDGAGDWRTLWSVIMPSARTSIIAAGMFSFLFAWGDFLWALTLNTNGRITPISLSLFQFIGANRQIEWGAIMATATLAMIPAALLLIGAQRYIAAGLTAGAVKE